MKLSRAGEFTLLLVATLTIMVGAALAPGLNAIAPALGMQDYGPLLITLPALGAVVFAPVFGRLIDRFGPHRVLFWGLWCYAIVGGMGVLVHGVWAVAIDRILLGGFAAGLMASGTAVISQWYQGLQRLVMIARQGMAIELGGVIFLFVGGLLSELSWRGPFLLYGLGVVCALMVLFLVPDRSSIASGGVGRGEAVPEETGQPIGSVLVFAVVAMAVFFSMVVTLPGYLAQVGFSGAQTGYLLSFISLVAVISAMFMPKVVKRMGEQKTLSLAFICYGVAHGLFAASVVTASLVLAAVFAGAGFGLSIPLLNHATVERSTESNRGRNLSYFAMAVFSGQFLTSFLELMPPNHAYTLGACALVSLAAAVASVWATGREPAVA